MLIQIARFSTKKCKISTFTRESTENSKNIRLITGILFPRWKARIPPKLRRAPKKAIFRNQSYFLSARFTLATGKAVAIKKCWAFKFRPLRL
jgi:hypothetical protein